MVSEEKNPASNPSGHHGGRDHNFTTQVSPDDLITHGYVGPPRAEEAVKPPPPPAPPKKEE